MTRVGRFDTRHELRDNGAAYDRLAADVKALLAGERDLIANAANTAALIFGALPEINWAAGRADDRIRRAGQSPDPPLEHCGSSRGFRTGSAMDAML